MFGTAAAVAAIQATREQGITPRIEHYDELAGMRPKWLVRPLVWLAGKMTGPLFIVEFVAFLIVWMAMNTAILSRPFDPWPFMGLNLFMSALAGIQAAVIGVKQTITEYRRAWADQCHQDQQDRIIEHIEKMEEAHGAELRDIKALIRGGAAQHATD